MLNIFIEDSQNVYQDQRSKASTERNQSPILKELKESLLGFILVDKLLCILTLIGVTLMAVMFVYIMHIEEGCIDCNEPNDGMSIFSKEQVILAAVVTAFVLLNSVCTLIVLNQFWKSVLQKELGFLHFQRIWGLVVLLVKIVVVLACFAHFDYDAKIIMVSIIPLCYHYIFLMKLAKYISEIKIANHRVYIISV